MLYPRQNLRKQIIHKLDQIELRILHTALLLLTLYQYCQAQKLRLIIPDENIVTDRPTEQPATQ